MFRRSRRGPACSWPGLIWVYAAPGLDWSGSGQLQVLARTCTWPVISTDTDRSTDVGRTDSYQFPTLSVVVCFSACMRPVVSRTFSSELQPSISQTIWHLLTCLFPAGWRKRPEGCGLLFTNQPSSSLCSQSYGRFSVFFKQEQNSFGAWEICWTRKWCLCSHSSFPAAVFRPFLCSVAETQRIQEEPEKGAVVVSLLIL